MKTVLAVAAVLVTAMVQAVGQQQPQSQSDRHIQTVMLDYNVLSYASQLTVIANAIRKDANHVDTKELQEPLANAAVDVMLDHIQAGPIQDIVDHDASEFISLPKPGQDVLVLNTQEITDRINNPYGGVKLKWGPTPQDGRRDPSGIKNMTIRQLLVALADQEMLPFKSYVSVQVTISFQKRIESYNALYLFPESGGPDILPVDFFLVGEGGDRYSQKPQAYNPTFIATSKWRLIPTMHDWLASHTINDISCTHLNALCCVHDQCGMRQQDFDRKMAQPIPTGYSVLGNIGSGITVSPLDTGACQFQDPEHCACQPGQCIAVPAPYPVPPATCTIILHHRKVSIIVPTGKWHTYISTVIHGSTGGTGLEVFDGGPGGNCILSCGLLVAAAVVGPWGWESGDSSSGNNFWSSGDSDSWCSSILDIQSSNQNNFPKNLTYVPWGPSNSNSVTYSAMSDANLLGGVPNHPLPQITSQDTPGWYAYDGSY